MKFAISPDLPHLDPLPSRYSRLQGILRPAVRFAISRYWQIHTMGVHHIPARGPVIFAANHLGALDGPLLLAVSPRVTFALVKREMFTGLLGRLLLWVGQIPVYRKQIDPFAIRRSTQVLRAGQGLAVFPEGVRTAGEVAWSRGGAAYLAMVTGAPIVPVALLGTREPGHKKDDLPGRGAHIHVVYGAAIEVQQQPWPRRKGTVADLNEAVRVQLARHVRTAEQLTGMALPGPPAPTPPKARPF